MGTKGKILKIALILLGILSLALLFIVEKTYCDDVIVKCEGTTIREQVMCGMEPVKQVCVSHTLFEELKPFSYIVFTTTILAIVTEFIKNRKIRLTFNILSLISTLLLIASFIVGVAQGKYNQYILSWNLMGLSKEWILAALSIVTYAIILIINISTIIKKTTTHNTRK